MKSTNFRYISGLDHIRAFAGLLIVFYHGVHILSYGPRAPDAGRLADVWMHSRNPLIALVAEGHTAVSLFMVLSGFIFTWGADGKEVRYFPYIKNRLLRIYPLYVTMLFVGVAAAPSEYTASGMLQALLFPGNLAGSLFSDPFTTMFWAVGVEVQFYLIFPFLHRFLETRGLRWAAGLVVVIVVLRTLALLGPSNARDISYWNIVGRLDQFVIGMVTAHVARRVVDRVWGWPTGFAGAVCLTGASLIVFNQLGGGPVDAWWRLLWPTWEAVCWGLVLLTWLPLSRRLPAGLDGVLARVGTWSFSIYLLHFPVLRFLSQVLPLHLVDDPDQNALLYTAVVVVPVLLPLSALTFFVIEKPFLSLRVHYLGEALAPESTPASTPAASQSTKAGS